MNALDDIYGDWRRRRMQCGADTPGGHLYSYLTIGNAEFLDPMPRGYLCFLPSAGARGKARAVKA